MFVRSALVLTGIGVAIGVFAAAGLTQFMKSLLFGISPLDPFTYIAISWWKPAALASYSCWLAAHLQSIRWNLWRTEGS